MDKKLYNYLLKIGFENEDVDMLLTICPSINIVAGEKALLCLFAVIERGFPEEDIDSLISLNPGIMLYNLSDLRTKLKNIDGDIEKILKNNPFIL